jgi:hypothetical protein
MRSAVLVLCLGLAGCLAIAVPLRLDVASRAARPAVCVTREECDAAWAKAVEWVSQRCAFKIQTQTNELVETAGPSDAPSTDVACRLDRVPDPEAEAGTARLELTPRCGNWFECDPERTYLQAAFNDEMRAAITAGREPTRAPSE